MADRKGRYTLGLAVFTTIVIRLAIIWPHVGREVDDPDHYVDLAHSLATSHQFAIRGKPTAYRPPLYPLLLAPLIGEYKEPANPLVSSKRTMSWQIATLHVLLGVGTVVFTIVAGRRFGLTPLAAGLAGGIVGLDPLLAFQARAIMTETLAAFLLAWALAAAANTRRWGTIETGVALGLAALCRPSTLAGAGLFVAFLALAGPADWRKRIASGAVLASTVVVVLAPWAIRNKIVLGEFVWTTTHGGYTLALANNADYYRDVLNGPPGAVWDEKKQRSWALEIAKATDGMTEPQADRWLSRSAWKMLIEQPGNFFRASIARLGRFWAIAPSAAVYSRPARLAAACWNVPLLILAGLGLCQSDSWRWPRAAAPALLLGLTLVHFLYWTDMRMRAPIVPAVALAAGMGFLRLKKSSKENPESPSGRVVA